MKPNKQCFLGLKPSIVRLKREAMLQSKGLHLNTLAHNSIPEFPFGINKTTISFNLIRRKSHTYFFPIIWPLQDTQATCYMIM